MKGLLVPLCGLTLWPLGVVGSWKEDCESQSCSDTETRSLRGHWVHPRTTQSKEHKRRISIQEFFLMDDSLLSDVSQPLRMSFVATLKISNDALAPSPKAVVLKLPNAVTL